MVTHDRLQNTLKSQRITMLDFGGDPLQRLASGTDLKLLWVIVTLAILGSLTFCVETVVMPAPDFGRG